MSRAHAVAFVLFATVAVATATPAAHAEPSVRTEAVDPLAGTWRMAERDLTIRIYRSVDGAWQGTIIASPRAGEVGRWVMRNVRWDQDHARYSGTLAAPETGLATVTLVQEGPDAFEVVAKRFLFSKRFVWTRAR